MGVFRESIPVIWDTSSSYLSIQGYECATCTSAYKYNYQSESGISFKKKSNAESEMNYGSASFSGFYATDTVCLQNSSTTCTTNFDIFIMTKQQGMPTNVAAISGLGADSGGTAPNLIKSMKSSGIITDSVFCFYLDGVTASYLDIGIIDKTAMKESSNLNMIASSVNSMN